MYYFFVDFVSSLFTGITFIFQNIKGNKIGPPMYYFFADFVPSLFTVIVFNFSNHVHDFNKK